MHNAQNIKKKTKDTKQYNTKKLSKHTHKKIINKTKLYSIKKSFIYT